MQLQLCSSAWPQIHRDPPASVLGLMACSTTLGHVLQKLCKYWAVWSTKGASCGRTALPRPGSLFRKGVYPSKSKKEELGNAGSLCSFVATALSLCVLCNFYLCDCERRQGWYGQRPKWSLASGTPDDFRTKSAEAPVSHCLGLGLQDPPAPPQMTKYGPHLTTSLFYIAVTKIPETVCGRNALYWLIGSEKSQSVNGGEAWRRGRACCLGDEPILRGSLTARTRGWEDQQDLLPGRLHTQPLDKALSPLWQLSNLMLKKWRQGTYPPNISTLLCKISSLPEPASPSFSWNGCAVIYLSLYFHPQEGVIDVSHHICFYWCWGFELGSLCF